MGDGMHDGWFAAWHWFNPWGRSLAPLLALVAGATFSALGGLLARRRESVRERRAEIMLDVVPILLGSGTAAWRWRNRDSREFNATLQVLRRRALAASRRDVDRVDVLSSQLDDLNARLVQLRLEDSAERQAAKKATVPVPQSDDPAEPQDAAVTRDLGALARSHDRSAERQIEAEEIRTKANAVTEDYVSWLETRLRAHL